MHLEAPAPYLRSHSHHGDAGLGLPPSITEVLFLILILIRFFIDLEVTLQYLA